MVLWLLLRYAAILSATVGLRSTFHRVSGYLHLAAFCCDVNNRLAQVQSVLVINPTLYGQYNLGREACSLGRLILFFCFLFFSLPVIAVQEGLFLRKNWVFTREFFFKRDQVREPTPSTSCTEEGDNVVKIFDHTTPLPPLS